MKNIYTAKVNIQGVEGIVGGNSAEDLAQGVQACVEAIETEIAKVKAPQKKVASIKVKAQEPSPIEALARLYDRVLADLIEPDYEDEDEDNYEDEDDYEDDCPCDCCGWDTCSRCPHCN